MRIVSASRRTDIPAFFSRWFFDRLDAGWCETVNPFNGVAGRVSLLPGDVAGFVFWTRFAAPMLPRLPDLDRRGLPYYFHFTINGYDRDLESRNPDTARAIDSLRALADRIGPDRVIWRYDPIIFSSATGAEWHIRNFERLSSKVAGYTSRCYFSFLDIYGKTKRNLVALEKRGGPTVNDETATLRSSLATQLRDIAIARNIRLYACCEDAALAPRIHKGHCVDTELLGIPGRYPARPTRDQCGCVESVDIGAYDTCRFGCVYCYATNSYEAAVRKFKQAGPMSPALGSAGSLAVINR